VYSICAGCGAEVMLSKCVARFDGRLMLLRGEEVEPVELFFAATS